MLQINAKKCVWYKLNLWAGHKYSVKIADWNNRPVLVDSTTKYQERLKQFIKSYATQTSSRCNFNDIH